MIRELKALNSSIQVQPSNPGAVVQFRAANADDLSVAIGPVVLRIPERGGTASSSLFLYLRGHLEFSREAWKRSKDLVITDMGTETAHFRPRADAGELELVHGAHYDYAPGAGGHPVFHMQLQGSIEGSGEAVRSLFKLTYEPRSGVRSLLRNVRSPCAQVDAFSYLLQVAADHLLPPDASEREREVFNELRDRSALCGPRCREAGDHGTPSTGANEPNTCYRARHWYPRF